jgi:hypothetical protein
MHVELENVILTRKEDHIDNKHVKQSLSSVLVG